MPVKYRKYVSKRLSEAYKQPEENTLDNPSQDVREAAKRPNTDYMLNRNPKKATKN